MNSPLSFTGAAWLPAAGDDTPSHDAVGPSEVVEHCRQLRWGQSADRALFAPSLEHLLDPYAMRNMSAAIDRLQRALRDRQRIRIITDYDVDGTTSSLILQAALNSIDPTAQVDYHIPDRFTEGYGFSVQAADKAAQDGVQLIITADIGVRDHAAVARAREHGIDVLICDHHLPEGAEVPPEAIVLCPPQEGCGYPNKHLAACGVSLKLAQALLEHHPRRERWLLSMMKLAAIGSVADLVPLTGLENRAIVSLGLRELNRGPHLAGLQALLDICKLSLGNIREKDLGYRVGPRINAAGRLADATLVVSLLTCRDPQRAHHLATDLDQLNSDRRLIQRRLIRRALGAVGDPPDPFVLLSGPEAEGWHRGVVGIVASRLKDELHRPVAIVSIQGDRAVGSVRCPPTVHAVEALGAGAEWLVKFGGHPAAAGFTIPTARLQDLHQRLIEYAVSQRDTPRVPRRTFDAEIPPRLLTQSLHNELRALAPFGMGNPEPHFVLRSVRPRNMRVRGKKHLSFLVPTPNGRAIEAIWWEQAKRADALTVEPVDLLGTLGENRWRGQRKLQFTVTDARLSEGS